jgi:hypothetical protein
MPGNIGWRNVRQRTEYPLNKEENPSHAFAGFAVKDPDWTMPIVEQLISKDKA